MIENFVDITTDDGRMNTFLVHPEEEAPHPVVLFLMDAPGMREEIRDMCRRLGSAGYYVIASNLYYREEREFNVFELGGTRDRAMELMGTLSNALVVADAERMIEFADADPAADVSRTGVLGYCMSGPFALMTAAANHDRVKAVASLHGVKLATDSGDSPHRHLDAMNAEVYIGAAEFDEHISVDEVNAFDAALAASSTSGRVEWYPGTHHGFTFAGRGPIYDKPSSERHWERMHALFRRTLE